jgi:hypothetical protein
MWGGYLICVKLINILKIQNQRIVGFEYLKVFKKKIHKNPIKDQWPEPSQGRQKGKAKRCTTHKNQKKGKN